MRQVAPFTPEELCDSRGWKTPPTKTGSDSGADLHSRRGLYRLKQRFRQLLKAEVAGTLDDPGLVEAEMRALFAALGS